LKGGFGILIKKVKGVVMRIVLRHVIVMLLIVVFSNECFTAALVTSRKNIDIQKVIDYQLPRVRARYQKDYKVSAAIAKEHETELKRYLILSSEYDQDEWAMYSPDVDNFWHTFLLFTKDYDRFCKAMFGKFLHHEPMDKKYEDVQEALRKKDLFMQKYQELFGQKPSALWFKDHGSNCCSGNGHECISPNCCAKQ
jgi:hypothetical protein